MISATISTTPQFYDIDAMEVVWHGNYPRFLEEARRALLERIGYSYTEMRASGFAWPIVDMRLKYVRPIRWGQKINVEAKLLEYQNRLKIDYLITDQDSGEVLNKAHTVQVAVHLTTGELQLESPPVLLDKLRDIA